MRFIRTLTLIGAIRNVDSAAIDVLLPTTDDLGPRVVESPQFKNLRKRKDPALEGWGSGSILVPQFNHKTRREAVHFLTYYGALEYGQFGTDKIHKPDLKSKGEEIIPSGIITPQSGKDSTIELGFAIYYNGHTGVYNIEGHPDKVIKYHAYCFDEGTDPIDATVVEAYFMKRLEGEAPGITLKVDYYSGYDSTPGSIPDYIHKIPDVTCPEKRLPHIRYMIMDKVGLSLYAYMQRQQGGRIDFLEAMKLGIQMINLLKRLHGVEIVHGDAHMGNFAFRTRDVSSGLILIDLGRAELIDEEDDAAAHKVSSCEMIHPYAAKWEMTGCRVSFRDDVYRAVQMTAMSIYGMPHFLYLQHLMKKAQKDEVREPNYRPIEDIATYMLIKETAHFWELGPMLNLNLVLSSTDEPTRQQIRTHLASISTLILEPALPYAKPNYDGIIAEYEAIIGILTTAPRFIDV